MRAPTAKLIIAVTLIAAWRVPRCQAQTRDEALQSGIHAFQSHNFAAAEKAFTQLVHLDPSARNYDYLAAAEVAGGKLDRAIADFQKSILLGNHSASVHYDLGLAYVQWGVAETALEQFRKAVSLDPNYLPARYALGMTMLRMGQAREAAGIFAGAHRQAPRDPRIWAAWVEAEFAAADSQQATATARDAIAAAPNNPRLAVTLAGDCLRHHQVETARNLLEDANETMPQNPEIRILLAKCSLLAGEPVEALAVLRDLPSAGKDHAERLQLTGEARALTGDLAAAQKDLASAIKDAPNDARYMTTYAWVQQLQGQYNAAIATLSKARALDPAAPIIPYRMAISYYLLGQYAQGLKYCRAALEANLNYGAAYFLLGITELKQKDFKSSLDHLRRAVSLSPGEALFHRELGEALFQSGDSAAAIKELDAALSLNPEDAESYFWRARLRASEGAEQQAITDLNTAVELEPNYSDAYADLAQLYAKTGHPRQAAKARAAQKQAHASSKSSGASLVRSLPENPQ
ncbi:MAG: tetratricopeptide repeat protein [Terriglobia bacterium]